MRALRVIVVGGGIGGMAAAIALHRRGHDVQVWERAAAVGAAGSGLTLWPNGLRALDAIGVGAEVRSRAMADTEGGIRDRSGRWLTRTDTETVADRYGPVVAIHRADLFDILRTALGENRLRLGVTVTGVDNEEPAVRVLRAGGAESADLVVGADGLRSVVRTAVCPHARPPRYAGYTAWRMVTEPLADLRQGGQIWGSGEIFGIVPLADHRVYMFGAVNAAEGEHAPDGEFAEVRRRFGEWPDPVPRLLGAVSPDSVMRHDIYRLPDLPTFVRGRVALLGDAAHAMTPNMGQGANLALEDAVTLAALLDHGGIDDALRRYDALRRPRTRALAHRSRRIGTVAQWSWTPAVRARDTALRLMPGWAMPRAFARALDWTPPA
ncbi:FAD-dependent urate hydroxylase [Nocardia cerradoensis]|uniref:FAD-dependent urate hydroxylase n=1 Tax=Nocardia cerradoensis TaxID=85688 RepID=A0A231H5E5_9NOCA|nr:FAD-dependent monooxygenase [Nocardia cerradoensis]OXR44173.1 FAD-dependent urate hydroxylase [Nocardia cerradoensis]